MQIYLNKDREASRALIDKVNKSNIAALIFTVDAAVPSKRTRDIRAKGVVEVRHTVKYAWAAYSSLIGSA